MYLKQVRTEIKKVCTNSSKNTIQIKCIPFNEILKKNSKKKKPTKQRQNQSTSPQPKKKKNPNKKTPTKQTNKKPEHNA